MLKSKHFAWYVCLVIQEVVRERDLITVDQEQPNHTPKNIMLSYSDTPFSSLHICTSKLKYPGLLPVLVVTTPPCTAVCVSLRRA